MCATSKPLLLKLSNLSEKSAGTTLQGTGPILRTHIIGLVRTRATENTHAPKDLGIVVQRASRIQITATLVLPGAPGAQGHIVEIGTRKEDSTPVHILNSNFFASALLANTKI